MRTLNELFRRTVELETISPAPDQKVTIEKHEGFEFIRWGQLIVKILRGGSMEDL